MTLMNSCYLTTLVHVVLLISTLCTVGINSTNRLSQLETSLLQQRSTNVVGGYDGRTRNDNKRYRNSFDIKTDINNLFYNGNIQQKQSQPLQQSPSTFLFPVSTRKRRETVVSQLTTKSQTTNTTHSANTIFNFKKLHHPTPSPIIIDNVSLMNLSHYFLNAISANSFRNLTKLTILDLSHNTIECFHLEAHKTLKILNLSANSLTKFNSEWCESLEQLDLSNNKFNNSQTINLRNLTNLIFVDLSCNELREIDSNLFRNTTNMKCLILAGNRLRYIAGLALFQLKKLELLDLSYNDISDIESDTFRNLVNLQTLDLSYNQFNEISLEALQTIPDLARLSVAGNVLKKSILQEFAVTWSINELDYSNVGLCDVPYSLAQSVRILNLYGNFVNIICSGDVDSYPLLHKLVLSNNQLTAIEDDALGRLEMLTVLYLDHNNLTQFPSSLPSNLIKLYINSNHISEIRLGNLVNLINLEMLEMSDNEILYLPQLPLPNLLILTVKSCGLHGVNHNLMQSSPKLRFLLIHSNLIKCSELIILDQCRDDANETIIDPFDTAIIVEQNDLERKDRILNSLSFFITHTDNEIGDGNDEDSIQCCQKGRTKKKQRGERLLNCWNDEQKQKLITSLNLTNEPDIVVPITTIATTSVVAAAIATSKDNNLYKIDTILSTMATKLIPKLNEQKNDENLRTKTIKKNNKAEAVEQKSVAVLHKSLSSLPKPQNKEISTNISKKITMKNSKKSTITMKTKGKLLMKKVQSMANKINGVEEDGFLGGSKNLSLEKIEAITTQKGLTNSILMKNKQITTITNFTAEPVAAASSPSLLSSLLSSSSLTKPIESVGNNIKYSLLDKLANENQTSANKNKNLIKINNIDYKQLNKAILTPMAILPPKAISDNENHYNIKSIVVQNAVNNNYNRQNNSHNGQPLGIAPRANTTGNDGVEATDHHLHTINQTLNGQQPEQWNDIRNDSNSHPGLLIVVGILSIGVIFTFFVVYVYRCNFVTSTRGQRCHRRGSSERINEGQVVLNDNFNEETRSFTIEHVQQPNNSNQPFSMAINRCDLLPMDILNSTLSQSVDQPEISMQVW